MLFPKEVPLLREARKVQKKAIISNFVDRESERPALTPNDFVQLPAINAVSESEHTNPTGKQKRKARYSFHTLRYGLLSSFVMVLSHLLCDDGI